VPKQKHIQKKKRREAIKRLSSPSSHAAHGVNDGVAQQPSSAPASHQPRMSLPIYYSDLTDHVPSEAEIDELVSSFVRRPTFFMLAMLNTFLSFYQHDSRKNFTEVQGFLFKNLTDEELFERVKQRFPHEQMGSRPLFHRQQMLVLIKKVLLQASDTGRYNPNDMETKEGQYALGRVALMTNDLLNLQEQAQRLEQQEGSEDDWRRRYEEFCTQMLPLYELSDAPEVGPGLVRNDEYFKIFERMAAQGKFVFSDGKGIADRFLKLTKLKLKDYLLMILSVHLNYLGVATEEGAIKQLMDNPAKFNVAIDVIFSKMRFTADERRAFFRQTSINVAGLIEACRVKRSKLPLMQQYDFTALRTYPLIYTREQEDIVTCLDSSFLAEKVSTGVYYNIKLPLEEAAKKLQAEGKEEEAKIAQKDHDNFLGYWGSAFEIYVNDRLRDVLAPRLKRFYASPYYDKPPTNKSDAEAFDAVLDYGSTLVVFEHKGKYLDLGAKYSGERDVLLAELKSTKRIGKGLYQLADNLQWVFDNSQQAERHTFHERGTDGKPIKRFELKDIGRVRRIYPVIVHQDFSIRLNGMNQIMSWLFEEEIAKRRVDRDLVRPLSLISVEDLEMVIPHLFAIPLMDILDEYARDNDPLMTFEKIFRRLLKKKRITFRRNQWLDQRFEEIRQEIRDLFIDLSD
jgi:hypothetical protein